MLPLYPNNIRSPALTLTIILINAMIFIYFLSFNNPQIIQAYYKYGLVPVICFNNYISFFTYQFLHDNLLHLLGNMWLLWIGGSILEANKPRLLYVMFIIFSSAITGLIFCLINIDSNIILIGLSGAVAAIMGYVSVIATNTVKTYVFPFFMLDISIKTIALLWFSIQCLLWLSYPQSGISYVSHVSGFVVGVGLGLLDYFK